MKKYIVSLVSLVMVLPVCAQSDWHSGASYGRKNHGTWSWGPCYKGDGGFYGGITCGFSPYYGYVGKLIWIGGKPYLPYVSGNYPEKDFGYIPVQPVVPEPQVIIEQPVPKKQGIARQETRVIGYHSVIRTINHPAGYEKKLIGSEWFFVWVSSWKERVVVQEPITTKVLVFY